MKHVIILMTALCLLTTSASAAVIFSDDFDGYSDAPSAHGWFTGSAVSVETGANCRRGRCVKITYTVEGTGPYILSRNINTPEAYFRFYFKRTNHSGLGGGCKFFKLRAWSSDSNYANITTQMNYWSGSLIQVDHGCGSTLTNDQSCGGPLGGGLWGIGTVITPGQVYTFPDENWHFYEAYVKLNTSGNADGAYTLWVDGIKYREVTGVVIRNDANPTAFTDLLLGDYNAYGATTPYQYELYYDDIMVSDQYIGAVSSTSYGVLSSSFSGSATFR